MTISVDEYKIEACSLTDEECIGGDCDACQVLKDHDAEIMASSPAYEKERRQEEERLYTVFHIPKDIFGVPVMSNEDLTIGHIDTQRLLLLQEIDIISKTETPYSPAALKQYNHPDSSRLRLFRKHNNLGIPDHIWAKKDFPAAFQWGDNVYIIAPVVDSE